MLSRLNHVGLNLTKNKLQLVEVVNESSKYCLENVGEYIFTKEFDFDSNESEIISVLQSAFNTLTSNTPLKGSNISVSISLKEFKVFEIPFDASLSKKALDEHIKWEFSILLPTLRKDDYIIRTLPLSNRDKQNRLLVVGLKKKIAKAIHSFSIQNNLQLKFIDNSHFSSDSTINFQENKNIISIYLCADYCSINSYLGRSLQSSQRLEYLDNNALVDSVNHFIESQNIAYDEIFIGSSLDVDEIKNNLESRLNSRVEAINPFDSIITSESFIQNAYFMNHPNTFSAAAGICYRKI